MPNTKYQKVFLFLLVLFITSPLLAKETIHAKVTGDMVNVRARPVSGSEIVTQLRLEEEVEVLEKGIEWTKIKAPVHSKCWVHSDYVRTGRITANSVNLRCGPGIAFPVLCQLDRGTGVSIVEVIGDWIRIEPPVEFGVWVSSQYIKYPESVEEFVEEEIVEAEVEAEVRLRREEEIVKEEEIVEEPVLPVSVPEIPITVSVSPEEMPKVKLVSYAGTLEDLGIIINRPGTCKLVSIDGKWICILKSPTIDLNPYVNRIVRIEGVVVAISSSWNVPVIEVKRLQVIK